MKALIITEKISMDDERFSYFYSRLLDTVEVCEKITVLCLEQKEYTLPPQVSVFSLGKEAGKNRFTYLKNFYNIIWREKENYDIVFIHLNPVYVLLGGIFWRLWRKKIILWYNHSYVDWKLKIAEILTHTVATASRDGFRIKSKKIILLENGLDLLKCLECISIPKK